MAILGLRVRWYSNETRYGELDLDPPAVEDLAASCYLPYLRNLLDKGSNIFLSRLNYWLGIRFLSVGERRRFGVRLVRIFPKVLPVVASRPWCSY